MASRGFWFFTRQGPLNCSEYYAKLFFNVARDRNEYLVRKLVDQPGVDEVFFDIGGNCGFFSKAVIESGFSGSCILFEPIPNLMSISVKTLKRFANLTTFVNAAVSNEFGNTTLYFEKGPNIGWITAIKEKITAHDSLKVPVVDIKPYIVQNSPNYIKIDVEGSEAPILNGIAELINNSYQPRILVELAWGISNPNWKSCLQALEIFHDKNYRLINLNATENEIGLDELAAMQSTCDLLLIPK